MSIPISSIVTVDVTQQQATQSLVDFGLACVFTEDPTIPRGEYRTYESITAFDEDFPNASSIKTYGDTFFSQDPIPTKLLVARVDIAGGDNYPAVIENLSTLIDFYAVGVDSLSLLSADMLAIALKVEALELMWVQARGIADVAALNTTLKGNNCTRTALIMIDDGSITTNRPDAGWLGTSLTKQAGAFNWANETLTGVTTTTQSQSVISALLLAGINVYVDIGNSYKWTREGRTCAATIKYLDQVQGEDWVKINVEETIGDLMDSRSISYTDADLEIAKGNALRVMTYGQELGILDASIAPTVTMDSVMSVPVEQREARIAPTMYLTARLSGAVNNFLIKIALGV